MKRFPVLKWMFLVFISIFIIETFLISMGNFSTSIIAFFALAQILAGFIIGLGAVTVIDLHGFLAQNSQYWTESTIRAHKVTKPLIWCGIFLLILGKSISLISHFEALVTSYDFILIALLILNGCFLSFGISPALLDREKAGKVNHILPPEMQNKIKISFVFSVLGWWGLFFSTVYSLIFLN